VLDKHAIKETRHQVQHARLHFVLNINTVAENKMGYTKRKLKGAELARTMYANLGYPSMKDYKWVIQSNQIKDCPVTVDDVVSTNKIWGKDIAAIKCKTTREKALTRCKGLCKGTPRPTETSQRSAHDCRHLLLQPDTFLPHSQPQNLLHGNAQSIRLNRDDYFQGF
jgi:hypothetical protein